MDLDLNQFFLDTLELNESAIVKFIGAESKLTKQLIGMKDRIDARYEKQNELAMEQEESQRVHELKEIVSGDDNYKKFWAFQKRFFEQNKMSNVRMPTSEPTKVPLDSEKGPQDKAPLSSSK